jgi:hypothetical protein
VVREGSGGATCRPAARGAALLMAKRACGLRAQLSAAVLSGSGKRSHRDATFGASESREGKYNQGVAGGVSHLLHIAL